MVPSLSLLYYYGLINLDRNLTVKVTGHQWYWSYEYTDYEDLNFVSYIMPTSHLKQGVLKLLEDNWVVLPIEIRI